MSIFLYDSFTDAAGTLLESHTGETGATWTRGTVANGESQITASGTVRPAASTGVVAYTASGTPAAADYDVVGVLSVKSLRTNDYCGVTGRVQDGNNYYGFTYQHGTGYYLFKQVAGSLANLGSTDAVTAVDGDILDLRFRGTTISAYVNGTQIASVTDTSFSAAGKAGIFQYAATSATDTTGVHLTSITASPPPVTIAVNDANLFLSPGNWYLNGSTYAQSNNPGAYLKTGFGGTSCVLLVDVSPLTTGSVPSASYPTISYSVDDATPTTVQLTSASTSIAIASGLTSGNHTLRIDYVSGDFAQDRWTAPAMVLRIIGISVDGGSASVAPTLRAKRMMIFGDSITEAAYTLGATSPGGQDATQAFGHGVGASFNAEAGIIGFSGQGYENGGLGNTPSLPNSITKFDSIHSRVDGSGHFLTQPDYILAIEGTNGTTTTADINSLFASLRAAAPSAIIFIGVPFGGFAISAFTGATPPDANCHIINLGSDAAIGLTGTNNSLATREAAAGPHPRPFIHGQLGARLAAAINAVIFDPGPSNVRAGLSYGNGETGTLTAGSGGVLSNLGGRGFFG